MTALTLDVRIDGFVEPVGVLARDEKGSAAFAYRPDYLANSNALRLSLRACRHAVAVGISLRAYVLRELASCRQS